MTPTTKATTFPPRHRPRTHDVDGNWIQTFTGRKFYPLDVHPDDVDITDIAHALSLVNRYGGHTRVPYSVAQHSVIVSHVCLPVDALWGLLHDASEAYIGDVCRPLKLLPAFAEYRRIEADLMAVICERFDLPYTEPLSVKEADRLALTTEARDLRSPLVPGWKYSEANGYSVLPQTIVPCSAAEAEAAFLARFAELTMARS